MVHLGDIIEHAYDFLIDKGYQLTRIKLISAKRTDNMFIIKLDVGILSEGYKVLTYNKEGELQSMIDSHETLEKQISDNN